jgi:hypothetical protein
MPVRLWRRGLAGICCTSGVSNAAGVESWRRCCIRRRETPVGEFVDSMMYAGRVRGLLFFRGYGGPIGSDTETTSVLMMIGDGVLRN